jgi:hypothetical protein
MAAENKMTQSHLLEDKIELKSEEIKKTPIANKIELKSEEIKKTPRDINETIPKTSLFIKFLTFFELNKDLAILCTSVVLFTIFGYILALIKMGISPQEIKLSLTIFLEFLGTLLAGVVTIIWKLKTPPGLISSFFIERMEERVQRAKFKKIKESEKEKKEIDMWGNSLPPNLPSNLNKK